MTGGITIELAEGTYRLSAPLAFTSADSGTGGYTVFWKAALDAHPVITGAQKATGWTVQDSAKNIWRSSVGTGFDTRHLSVDGVMATGARAEVTRSDLTATTNGYTFTNSSLSYLNNLAQPGRTEIHGIGSFTDRYAPVTRRADQTVVAASNLMSRRTDPAITRRSRLRMATPAL
ncbi:hypothetical protein [Streptomyces azureus]|uniref:Uncharacterized protein n=1 Tax=Streptomyces azureus TaxID=146537 RepID=A0A0K8PLJ6_STRAJ|nr:hypothetical protein [Streptomyces azureus]GAP48751.1 uncharacterized protein SAZU_3587 [Streptomyces azureus]